MQQLKPPILTYDTVSLFIQRSRKMKHPVESLLRGVIFLILRLPVNHVKVQQNRTGGLAGICLHVEATILYQIILRIIFFNAMHTGYSFNGFNANLQNISSRL